MSTFFIIVFELFVRLIITGGLGFLTWKLFTRSKPHKFWGIIAGFFVLTLAISIFTPSSYSAENRLTFQNTGRKPVRANLDSDENDSSSSNSSSKPKAKKAKIDKHPTTIDATTKYLKHEIGDTAIDKVSMTDGILNVEYNGRSFAGKFMGSGTASNMADDLKLAQGLPLAKKGVTFLQVDTYSDNKGNEKKLLSYAIYYSRKNLDSINFANYSQVIGHTPKLLFTNATGYYVTKAMQSGKKNQIKGIDEARIDNDAIIADYMDHYHTN